MNKIKLIKYQFEGYIFQIRIIYKQEDNGVKLEKFHIVNTTKQIINDQEFYHYLTVLRNELINHKHDDKITSIIENS